MKKVVKVRKLCSKPLRARVLASTATERNALMSIVEQESEWVVNKMQRKGYRLEGTVAGVYGIFTRGAGRGAIQVSDLAPTSA